MNIQPTITTARLVLRPFTLEDSERVQVLADDGKIADTTASIPHPYPDGVAKAWISTHPEKWLKQENVAYAITLKNTGIIITLNKISKYTITMNAMML